MDLSQYTIQQLNAGYAVINRAVIAEGSDDVALRNAFAAEIEQRVDAAHSALLEADAASTTV